MSETTAFWPEPTRTLQHPHWTLEDNGSGRMTARLDSFASFDRFLRALAVLDDRLVWRGQANPEWPLESSLDRLRERSGLAVNEQMTTDHLDRFIRVARRRMTEAEAPDTPDEWWALGRHFGLATPLLDWTRSPWIAAYFAYRELSRSTSRYSAIFALDRPWVEARTKLVVPPAGVEQSQRGVSFVLPVRADNARAISQGGVFTRAPDGVTIDRWVEEQSGPMNRGIWLLRVLVPTSERAAALQMLAGMMISHQSLFPDLIGAADQANLDFEMFMSQPSLYWTEFLSGEEEANRPAIFSVQHAKTGEVDPVRTTFRAERPLSATNKSSKLTLTARDADGAAVPGAEVQYVAPLVRHTIHNPFR